MDFNTITKEQEVAAKTKFNEHNAGLVMNRLVGGNYNANASKYACIMNAKLFDMNTLANKLKELGRTINNQVQDDILGDTSVMFTVTNAKDQRVSFTYLEGYAFLRGIVRERQEAAEYRSKKAQLIAAQAILGQTMSAKDRRKAAEADVAKLSQELGIEVAATQQN